MACRAAFRPGMTHGDFMRRVSFASLGIASLLAGTALAALSAPAFAAAKKPADAPQSDPRIGVLEQQLRDVQHQLAEIKDAQNQIRARTTTAPRCWTSSAAPRTSMPISTTSSPPRPRPSISQWPPHVRLRRWRFHPGAAQPGAVRLRLFRPRQESRQRRPEQRHQFPPRPARLPGHGLSATGPTISSMTSAATAARSAAISITPISNMTASSLSISASAPMTPSERLEDSTGSGDLFFLERARLRRRRPQYRRRARPRSRRAFSPRATTIWSRCPIPARRPPIAPRRRHRRHLRRPAGVGRPRRLAGRQSEPDLKWLLDGHVTDVFKLPDAAANVASRE